MDSFYDCGIVLRHSLAEANDLWRMCVINKLTVRVAARELSLEQGQAEGVVRLLRKVGHVPSPERLALVAMRDPGFNNEDIAEMFRRTPKWAGMVRMHAQELRDAEPIPESCEYLDEGLQPGDPSPEEIYQRAAELRAARDRKFTGFDSPFPHGQKARSQPGLRCYLWDGRHASDFPIRFEKWTGR